MTSTPADEIEYHRPETLEDACRLLDRFGSDAKVVAGGQSLSLFLRLDLIEPAHIVDVTGIDAMAGIDAGEDVVRIGATVTYAELASLPLANRCRSLGDAVSVIADRQVRNAGTVGGAVSHADPYLDILSPLLCLDATVEIHGPEGSRMMPLEEFCWGYMETDLDTAEVLTALTFEPDPTSAGSYEKVSNVHGGWATVGVATRVSLVGDARVEDARFEDARVEDARIEAAQIALTGVADTPVRVPGVESELAGEAATDETLIEAATAVTQTIDPMSDPSGSAEYKSKLGGNLVRRSLETSIERARGDS